MLILKKKLIYKNINIYLYIYINYFIMICYEKKKLNYYQN